eukprot:jgi/Orpsp1_1/1185132/evm.model.c7180000092461.1
MIQLPPVIFLILLKVILYINLLHSVWVSVYTVLPKQIPQYSLLKCVKLSSINSILSP